MNCKHCDLPIERCGERWISNGMFRCWGNQMEHRHEPKAEPASPVAQPENGEIMPYANWKEGDSVPAPAGKYAPPTPVHMPPRGVTTGTHKTKGDNYSTPVPNGDGLESAGQEVVREPLQPVVTRSGVAQSGAGGPINPFDMLKLDKIRMRAEGGYDISYNDVLYLIHGISKLLNPSTRPSSPSGQAATPPMPSDVESVAKKLWWSCEAFAYTGIEWHQLPIGSRQTWLERTERFLRDTASPTGDTEKIEYLDEAAMLKAYAAHVTKWPSDLPANGMGAMNLLTNFWTGDLKGLTKEGARIVDSLLAHVTKELRADVSRLETLVGQLEKIILKKDSDAAGLREQLEQVSIKTRNPKE